MITTHDLRQPLESQPYALERHEQDLRQRLTVQSDTSSGKDQEKKRSPSKEGKVMKGLQILNRWWDLLFDERQGKQWARSKGQSRYEQNKRGLNTKLHLAVDVHSMPVRVIITQGITAEKLLSDRGYDSDAILKQANLQGMKAVIPPRKNRKNPCKYDVGLYKLRRLGENAFLYLKCWINIISGDFYMLKNIIWVCMAVFYCVLSYADELKNFDAIKSEVLTGKAISLTLDFSQCTPKNHFYAYYSPKTILVTKDFIAFSDYHFTLNNPQFPNQATVENISYKLRHDGTLSFKSVILDPITFKEKGKQPQPMSCKIGEGAYFYSNIS
jgi:hypothetical protein